MTAVTYTKVGESHGIARLWLEGTRLSKEGITPGTRYQVMYDKDHTRVLVHIGTGDRVVSKRSRNGREHPIIDINSKELAELFGGPVGRVRVLIKPTGIVVSLHHQDVAERERFERIIGKLQAGEPLNVGSLAHGGGVLDNAFHAGLKLAGVSSRLAFAVEIEGKYLDASCENNPIWDERSIAIEAPMEEVEYHRLPKVEALVAGLPCTGASLSGLAKNKLKRAEEHETAGPLFVAFLEAIKALNPAVVLLENVPNYQNTASYTVIQSVLTAIGYEVHDTVLENMGSLEERMRFCMVAVTKGLPFDFANLVPLRQAEASISEILESVPDDSERWKTFDYLDAKEQRDKAAGKGFRRQLLDGSEPRCGTIGRGYQKARSTEPFLKHPTNGKQRLFTPAEHARAKTIPEQLVAGLCDTTAHEILGQSVIHTAFMAVGKLVGDALNGAAVSVGTPARIAA